MNAPGGPGSWGSGGGSEPNQGMDLYESMHMQTIRPLSKVLRTGDLLKGIKMRYCWNAQRSELVQGLKFCVNRSDDLSTEIEVCPCGTFLGQFS